MNLNPLKRDIFMTHVGQHDFKQICTDIILKDLRKKFKFIVRRKTKFMIILKKLRMMVL